MTTTRTETVRSDRMSKRDRNVIATLLVATFVVILNETIMSVALPTLMVDLSIDANTAQWLSTAFMLTMAVVIPTTGFLLQRLSTRTVYVLALGFFCAGTALAALAPGFWILLLAADERRNERGDVPGWVLITVMTAGLVGALWAIAGDQLGSMLREALRSVSG